jgi:hypothetical protein
VQIYVKVVVIVVTTMVMSHRRINMITKKSWKEFRDAGLFWWINQQLHIFGWALVADFVDGEIVEVYPARVKFRGFSDNVVEEGYKKVSRYLKENVNELLKEAEED